MATSLSSHLQEVPPQDVLLAMHNVAQVGKSSTCLCLGSQDCCSQAACMPVRRQPVETFWVFWHALFPGCYSSRPHLLGFREGVAATSEAVVTGVAGVPEQEFDADAIHAVLEQLTPQKLRMMLASKRFKVRRRTLLPRVKVKPLTCVSSQTPQQAQQCSSRACPLHALPCRGSASKRLVTSFCGCGLAAGDDHPDGALVQHGVLAGAHPFGLAAQLAGGRRARRAAPAAAQPLHLLGLHAHTGEQHSLTAEQLHSGHAAAQSFSKIIILATAADGCAGLTFCVVILGCDVVKGALTGWQAQLSMF